MLIKILGKISKKYPKLTFPEFEIKAYAEINPDKSENPHKNFSELEAIAGYVLKFGAQVVLVFDNQGRPDLYIKHQYVGERRAWNHDPAHVVGQIDIIPHIVNEYENPWSHRRYRAPMEVYNDFVEILDGNEAVNTVDNHLGNCGRGIDEMRAIKSESRDVRRVQRYVRQLLAEFEARHQGRP